ncbi:hypothetical protein C3L33_03167, partial [Rhododendron williamsianum]
MADTSQDSPDWASLPAHLLDAIEEKLIDLPDFIRFAVVCKPWLYAATIDNQRKQQHRALLAHKQIPMLMVPSSDPKDNNSDGEGQEKRSLYSITRFDPYTDFSEMEYDIIKVVLSADPYMAPDSYQVAAIYSVFSLVALIKSDDAAWTYISQEQLRLASDVIYYESHFHVIDEWCGLTKIKSFSGIDHSIELEAIIKPDQTMIFSSYLVESSTTGELLNVVRYLEPKGENDQYVTWYFKVYKLSHSSEQPHPTWVEIESIGGDALFLGDNYSFSLLASQFPGCWPNSIYFTSDFVMVQPERPGDMGIFNLVDKSFRMHYTHDPSHNGMPPPIWIVPTPLAK